MQDQNSLREQARKAAFFSPRAAFLRINAGQILQRNVPMEPCLQSSRFLKVRLLNCGRIDVGRTRHAHRRGRNTNSVICTFCPVGRTARWPVIDFCVRNRCRCGVGGLWSAFRLVRYMAARHQYRNNDRHVSHGVRDPKHPEPRHASDAAKARRIDSRQRDGTQFSDRFGRKVRDRRGKNEGGIFGARSNRYSRGSDSSYKPRTCPQNSTK
jgi:hypothetical protein